MENTLDQETTAKIGREFVWQYYTIMNKCPEYLYRFYSNISTLRHGDIEIAVGQKKIETCIEQLKYNNCAVKVYQMEFHPAIESGVLVMVAGEISRNGGYPISFTQTFVLQRRTARRFCVLNDVLCYDRVDMNVNMDERQCEREKALNAVESMEVESPIITEAQLEQFGYINSQHDIYYQNIEDDAFKNSNVLLPYFQADVAATSQSTLYVNDNGTALPFDYATQSVPQLLQKTYEQFLEEQQQFMSQMQQQCFMSCTHQNYSSPVSETDDSICNLSETSVINEVASDSDYFYRADESSQESIYGNTYAADVIYGAAEAICENNADAEQSVEDTVVIATSIKQADTALPEKFSNIAKLNTTNTTQPLKETTLQANTMKTSNANVLFSRNCRASLQLEKLQSKRIDINTRQRRKRISDMYGDHHQLFLGNIPPNATEEGMRKVFEKFGKIVELRILSNHNNKQDQRGRNMLNYGFLTFESPASVQKCLDLGPFYYPNNLPTGHRINIERKKRRVNVNNSAINSTPTAAVANKYSSNYDANNSYNSNRINAQQSNVGAVNRNENRVRNNNNTNKNRANIGLAQGTHRRN